MQKCAKTSRAVDVPQGWLPENDWLSLSGLGFIQEGVAADSMVFHEVIPPHIVQK